MDHLELQPTGRKAIHFFTLSMGSIAMSLGAVGLILSLVGTDTSSGVLSIKDLGKVLLWVGPTCAVFSFLYPIYYWYQKQWRWLVYEDRIEIYRGNRRIRVLQWQELKTIVFRENSVGLETVERVMYNLAFLSEEQVNWLAAWYNRKRGLPLALISESQKED